MARARQTGIIGALALTGAAPVGVPTVTDLVPVVLHAGVNHVSGFMPGGSAATIIRAWRENGNAHGHYVWMVLGGSGESNPAGLVGFEASADDPATGDTIAASPFDGERVSGDVRFATARIAGEPVSIAIKGMLDAPTTGAIANHVPATIRWYKLVHRSDDGIGPPDLFEIIGTAHTTKRYCNVDLAMRDVAGVPLPPDFAGANRVDGCFADG